MLESQMLSILLLDTNIWYYLRDTKGILDSRRDVVGVRFDDKCEDSVRGYLKFITSGFEPSNANDHFFKCARYVVKLRTYSEGILRNYEMIQAGDIKLRGLPESFVLSQVAMGWETSASKRNECVKRHLDKDLLASTAVNWYLDWQYNYDVVTGCCLNSYIKPARYSTLYNMFLTRFPNGIKCGEVNKVLEMFRQESGVT